MGALFLLALLTLAGFLKPGGVSPLGISGFSGKDTFPGRVKAAGRVKAREPVSGGIRLYLDHFSLKSSHLHSNQISETNSFKNPGIQTGIYSQNDSGSYQMIVYLKEGQTASVGSRILLEGELSLPGRAGNPGQFDAASYYLPRKILLILQDGVIEKQLEEGKNFTGFLAAIREKLQDSYWQVLGEEQAGTISAITLGDRSGLPEEIKTKRSAQLLALAESMSREFRAYYVGKEEEVLFEEPMEVDGETWYTGYTKEYVKIAAKTAEPLDNVMKRGRVEAALTDEIYRMKL